MERSALLLSLMARALFPFSFHTPLFPGLLLLFFSFLQNQTKPPPTKTSVLLWLLRLCLGSGTKLAQARAQMMDSGRPGTRKRGALLKSPLAITRAPWSVLTQKRAPGLQTRPLTARAGEGRRGSRERRDPVSR